MKKILNSPLLLESMFFLQAIIIGKTPEQVEKIKSQLHKNTIISMFKILEEIKTSTPINEKKLTKIIKISLDNQLKDFEIIIPQVLLVYSELTIVPVTRLFNEFMEILKRIDDSQYEECLTDSPFRPIKKSNDVVKARLLDESLIPGLSKECRDYLKKYPQWLPVAETVITHAEFQKLRCRLILNTTSDKQITSVKKTILPFSLSIFFLPLAFVIFKRFGSELSIFFNVPLWTVIAFLTYTLIRIIAKLLEANDYLDDELNKTLAISKKAEENVMVTLGKFFTVEYEEKSNNDDKSDSTLSLVTNPNLPRLDFQVLNELYKKMKSKKQPKRESNKESDQRQLSANPYSLHSKPTVEQYKIVNFDGIIFYKAIKLSSKEKNLYICLDDYIFEHKNFDWPKHASEDLIKKFKTAAHNGLVGEHQQGLILQEPQSIQVFLNGKEYAANLQIKIKALGVQGAGDLRVACATLETEDGKTKIILPIFAFQTPDHCFPEKKSIKVNFPVNSNKDKTEKIDDVDIASLSYL